MADSKVTLLSHSMLGTLEHDLTLASGKTVTAGTTVLILPETLSSCVLTPEGDSLATAWPTISRDGHTHAEVFEAAAQITRLSERLYDYDSTYPHSEIAQFAAELTRMSERLTALANGAVTQSDNTTCQVDSEGVLSVLGGNLHCNEEVWITASGTWTAPVTGWYDVLLIGGGDGTIAVTGPVRYGYFFHGGKSGGYKTALVHFTAGDTVQVSIGAGGVANPDFVSGDPGVAGGETTFGELTTVGAPRLLNINAEGTSGVSVRVISGGGFGAVVPDLWGAANAHKNNGQFWGAGGSLAYRSDMEPTCGSGKQGAVRLRFWNPAKANG